MPTPARNLARAMVSYVFLSVLGSRFSVLNPRDARPDPSRVAGTSRVAHTHPLALPDSLPSLQGRISSLQLRALKLHEILIRFFFDFCSHVARKMTPTSMPNRKKNAFQAGPKNLHFQLIFN